MWRLAAAAALLLPAMPAAAQRPAEAGRVERLALDLERSEAIRAIKRLQVAQAQLLLYGLWDEAAGLYARDAQVATGDRTVRGRAGIRAWLIDRFGYGEAAPAAKALRLQLMLAPVVTLAADGSSARGRWSELATTGVYGGRADWFGGMQENVYVREDGVWKIGRVAVFAQFAGSYAEGWRSPTPDLPVIPYHFVPSMAGRPVPDIPGGTERPAADTPAQLAALLAGTERRIAALNDEDAVRNLQGAYGYYVDRKMWDDAADLFAADARFEIAGVGGWRGPRGIRRALELDGPAPLSMGQVNDRLQLHLVVTVLPGGQARARGLQLGMITPRLGEAWWELASFENRYVKGADGKWRIAELRVFPVVKSDYYQGWARNWLPPAGPPRAQYPDTRARPGSAPAVPPFSYLHPVTGKPIAGGRGGGGCCGGPPHPPDRSPTVSTRPLWRSTVRAPGTRSRTSPRRSAIISTTSSGTPSPTRFRRTDGSRARAAGMSGATMSTARWRRPIWPAPRRPWRATRSARICAPSR